MDHHGEPDLPLPPPVIDNTRQPQMSDMTTCLNDLSYIPLNNEQNEPTQGNIGAPLTQRCSFLDPVSPNPQRSIWKSTCITTGEKSLSPQIVSVQQAQYDTTPQYDGRAISEGLSTTNYPDCNYPRADQEMFDSHFRGSAAAWLHQSVRKPSQSYSMLPVRLENIQSAFRPLINDLKDSWAKPGVETIDVATGLKLNMRAMKPHKWRRSLEFNGETEDGDPPREFSRDGIMTQLARLPTRVKGKHLRFRGVKIKRNVLVELN
ncbi:hypothetical protein Tco_1149980 [Tanacetum coccineum]